MPRINEKVLKRQTDKELERTYHYRTFGPSHFLIVGEHGHVDPSKSQTEFSQVHYEEPSNYWEWGG